MRRCSLLGSGADRQAWHPPTLNKAEFVLVNELCHKGSIDVSEPKPADFLKKEGETVVSVCTSLNHKGLATLDGQKLVLITDECACMILPDGRFLAAENKSGRLMRYAMKVTEAIRRQKVVLNNQLVNPNSQSHIDKASSDAQPIE